MGIGPGKIKLTIEGLIAQHIHSMKQYADELDGQPAMIKRRDVVNRILKCADELKTELERRKENN